MDTPGSHMPTIKLRTASGKGSMASLSLARRRPSASGAAASSARRVAAVAYLVRDSTKAVPTPLGDRTVTVTLPVAVCALNS